MTSNKVAIPRLNVRDKAITPAAAPGLDHRFFGAPGRMKLRTLMWLKSLYDIGGQPLSGSPGRRTVGSGNVLSGKSALLTQAMLVGS